MTMVLGGLWHGANWTFVVWGMIHGGWLAVHRMIAPRVPGKRPGVLSHLVRVFVTFHLVCLAWLFFRAETVTQAWAFLASFFSGFPVTDLVRLGFPLLAFYTIPVVLYEVWVERRDDLFAMTKTPVGVRAAFYVILLLALTWFAAPLRSEFIYFQF